MIRFVFLAHRYLGIAVGLVMLLWTLSGVIMMYQPYPELNRWEALALRDDLVFTDCCTVSEPPITRQDTITGARVEMLSGHPVLHLDSVTGGGVSYDLATGQSFDVIAGSTAASIAGQFVRSRYADSTLVDSRTLHNDQWTVYSSYHPHRPLYRYRISDQAGTEFYVSSRTGEIVQLTTAGQRLWGTLGAVIHWLYPTVLRQHTALWAQVVIWLTILGIFLTVTGIYSGLRQFRQRRNGRLSPYRGLQRYHHLIGLVFGLFTLTWVASGLLSMNPWGALAGEGIRSERERFAGRPLSWSELESIVGRLHEALLPQGTVLLEMFPQQDALVVVAHTGTGRKVRLAPEDLGVDELTQQQVNQLVQDLRPQDRVRSVQLLESDDAYYYTHHEPLEFPVYKVIIDNSQRTHYYLSAVDGRIQHKIDDELRLYRWLFYGLHRGDFSSLIRSRPVWDILMLLLLAGVAVICATGAYMGCRRLGISRRRSQSRSARPTGVGLKQAPH